jgi:hypothetical protein
MSRISYPRPLRKRRKRTTTAATMPKMRPRWTVRPPKAGTELAKSERRGSQADFGNWAVSWKPASLHGPKTQ